MKYYKVHICNGFDNGYETVVALEENDDEHFDINKDINYVCEDMALHYAESQLYKYVPNKASQEYINAYFEDAVDLSSYEEISRKEYERLK